MNNFPTPRLTPNRMEPPSPQESMINITTSTFSTRRTRTPMSAFSRTPRRRIPTASSVASSSRPRTSQSIMSALTSAPVDPPIPFSSTTSYIVSIINNKANQVGLAAMNQRSNRIYLTECTETSVSFQYSKSLIREYSPHTILFSTTLKKSNIVKEIKSEFPQMKFQFIARRFFNETKGVAKITHYCVPQNVVLPDVSNKYLCLSAFSALIDYSESIQGNEFAKYSFDVRYKSVNSHLLLDAVTIKNLELIRNLRTGSSDQTLFSVVNYTKTMMGKRLLRTNILQPLTDVPTIQCRQEAIEELLSDESMYLAVVESLKKVGDLEASVSNFTHQTATFSSKTGQRLLKNIIQLKQILLTIEPVAQAVRQYKTTLLRTISKVLLSDGVEKCLQDIDEFVDTDIKFTRNTLNMITQMCFAVHQGKSGLLDVARRVYSDAVTEVHALKKQIQDEAALSSLALKYSSARGYYFSLSLSEQVPERVKKKFVTSFKRGKRMLVSTQELLHLNRRISTTLDEIYLQSEKTLQELVGRIRSRIYLFSKVSESIGLLDLLQSFATLVIMKTNYVRPKVTEDGPLAIKLGRHPVLDSEGGLGGYVPNHTYISASSNFQILTGPNNSGKTTYMKQVGLIVILFQMGCWVPATFCSGRVFRRIFTKLSFNDELEHNCSTFMVEMREISQIVQNSTEESLVLIDELGRGTSNLEGVSIAWSIAEHLINLGAFTLFVTHYMKLCGLASLYPNVKNYHLQVSVNQVPGQEGESNNKAPKHHLTFVYRLLEGSTSMDRYGLNLARMVGFPQEVLEEAEMIFEKLIEIEKKRKEKMDDEKKGEGGNEARELNELKRKFDIGERIHRLKYSTLDLRGKVGYLMRLKQSLMEEKNKDREMSGSKETPATPVVEKETVDLDVTVETKRMDTSPDL